MGDYFDFGGYATKANLRCNDGLTIMKDAFKEDDGRKVPLVWQHQHNDPGNVIGHAILESRSDGVYCQCSLNNNKKAKETKIALQHGDIDALSIYANNLVKRGTAVVHGIIREVSVVLAGANPGALIDPGTIAHSDGFVEELEDEATIYSGLGLDYIDEYAFEHASKDEEDVKEEPEKEDKKDMAEGKNKTVGEVLNTLNEDQKIAVAAVIAEITKGKGNDDTDDEDEEDTEVKHNAFEGDEYRADAGMYELSHDDFQSIVQGAKELGGSFKNSVKNFVLQHDADYGIDNIDYLFPDARVINNTPDFIKREDSWVQKVLNGTHHTPFSRVKSIHADITADEARARGYVKGNKKEDEVIALLKRITEPQTIYKKQRLDRDDIIDITDMNVVAWLRAEMRMMLNEEIARAILIGDGRSAASPDKIKEDRIRPIYTDDDLYSVKVDAVVASTDDDTAKSKKIIKAIKKSRKLYKGSGNPTLYTTEDVLTDMLMIEDTTGREIYDTVEKLRTALRVNDIVTVPVMEGITRTDTSSGSSVTKNLIGVIVNLQDYNIGADKGGEINTFEDFDIDYNQEKYLIETRISGALVKPYSAMVVEMSVAAG